MTPSLAFNSRVLGLPGNIYSAIAANAIEGTAFAFLIILAQLVRYDWRMDDAASVFGAGRSLGPRGFRSAAGSSGPPVWPAGMSMSSAKVKSGGGRRAGCPSDRGVAGGGAAGAGGREYTIT